MAEPGEFLNDCCALTVYISVYVQMSKAIEAILIHGGSGTQIVLYCAAAAEFS